MSGSRRSSAVADVKPAPAFIEKLFDRTRAARGDRSAARLRLSEQVDELNRTFLRATRTGAAT